MWTKLRPILVLVVIMLLESERTEAAAACSCTPAQCECTDVSRIPQDLADNIPSASTNITSLLVRDSDMGNRAIDSFPSLPQLQSLTMVSMVFSRIQGNAFSNLPQIQNINFTSSNMTAIQPRAFSALDRLQTITLSNCRISSGIQPAAFSDLAQLRDLNLDNNRITAVQPGTFANLPMLRDIDLSSNQITRIQPNVFNNLTLTQLDLSENRIEASSLLAPDSCSELDGITTVSLGDNSFACNCDSLQNLGVTCSLDIIKQIRCTGAGGNTYPLTLSGGNLMCTSGARDLRASLFTAFLLLPALLLKNLLM